MNDKTETIEEEKTIATEEVVEPNSESADVTAAATTETTAETETSTTEKLADQETSADSETKPEKQETAPTQPDTETTEKVVDRIVPEVGDYVLPEGVPIEMAQFAKDSDFTQEQLDASMLQFGTITQANEAFQKQEIQKNGEAHVAKWGKQKDYNLSLLQRALAQNDPDGTLTEILEVSGFGNHPAVLDFMLSIGNSMREGGFLKGSVNTPKGTSSTAATSMFGANHPSTN